MSNSHGRQWLNTKQRREIDRIDQKSHYNLAAPPSSVDEITRAAKFMSLTDFIEQSDWDYSDLDIIDRREIESLGAETFWLYIGESDVPLEKPGHLSPVTVAKLIALGVELVGVFIEGATKNPALLCGTDFPACDRMGIGHCLDERSGESQFRFALSNVDEASGDKCWCATGLVASVSASCAK